MVRLSGNESEKVIELLGRVGGHDHARCTARPQLLDHLGVAQGLIQEEGPVRLAQDDLDLVGRGLHEADNVRAPEAGLRDRFTPTRLERGQIGALRIGRRLVVDIPIPAPTILVRNTAPPKARQWPIRDYTQRFKRVDLGRADGAQM